MRGVIFVGEREIEMHELPKPALGPGEVVLAMQASGLCGSDLRAYRAPRAQRGHPTALPVGGHEPCGVVAEVGPEVTTVQVPGASIAPTSNTWAWSQTRCETSGANGANTRTIASGRGGMGDRLR